MVPGPMPKSFKLSVLGCLLGMSAGAVLASSLHEASPGRLAGEDSLEGRLPAQPAHPASAPGTVASRRPQAVGGGFEAPPMHAIPARSPNAPMPPTWQSLLPGAIRL